ncbi:MAG TPA: hypothetical protein PK076_07410 [Saprospiraceae bacterium]|nr:hypothetical protein [Saprospiraceae bacterium]HQW55937.1 hypothetical protein [Saprospiraceae bacterium]
MTRILIRFLYSVALLICLSTVAQSQIQMLVLPDTNRMLLGDQIKIRLSVTADTSIYEVVPVLDSIKTIPGFEIVREGDWTERSTGLSRIMEKELLFTAFEPGTYQFPSLAYNYQYKNEAKTGHSKPFELTVLPVHTNTPDIEPIKDIIPEPRNLMDYLWWILGGIALLAVIYFLIRYFKARKNAPIPEKVIPRKPAKEIALEALEGLRKSELWSSEDHKAYQYRLTDIMRDYLHQDFKIPYADTTDGIILRLKKKNWPTSILTILDESFNIADLVKFANAESRAEINLSYIQKLEDIVKHTSQPDFQTNTTSRWL